MQFEFKRRRPTRHDDEVAGARPALVFALGLGVIAGLVAVGIFAGGVALIGHFGGVGSGVHGLIVGAATWLAFWVGLSVGLAGGLALGYRVWSGVATPFAARSTEAAAHDEARAAVREVEQLLHRTSHPREN